MSADQVVLASGSRGGRCVLRGQNRWPYQCPQSLAEKRKVTGSTPVPTTTDGQAKRLAIACFSASSAGPPVVLHLALFDRQLLPFCCHGALG